MEQTSKWWEGLQPVNRQSAKIKASLSRAEIAGLKVGGILKIDVVDSAQKKFPKEIRIDKIEQIGEFYSIEGTTTSGNKVMVEVNPNDADSNLMWWKNVEHNPIKRLQYKNR